MQNQGCQTTTHSCATKTEKYANLPQRYTTLKFLAFINKLMTIRPGSHQVI
jgi:hypothetical protein